MVVTTENHSCTEKAVRTLRAYARYLYDHAENIIGDIDAPNYVSEDGILVSFRVNSHGSFPFIKVVKEHLAIDVLDVDLDAPESDDGELADAMKQCCCDGVKTVGGVRRAVRPA